MEEFLYRCALLDKEGGATTDIQLARKTFYRLRRSWDTSEILQRDENTTFKNADYKSSFDDGCEAWKLMGPEAKKLDAFQYKCMKRRPSHTNESRRLQE